MLEEGTRTPGNDCLAFQEMASNAQKIGEIKSLRSPEIADRQRWEIAMFKKLVIVTRKTRLQELWSASYAIAGEVLYRALWRRLCDTNAKTMLTVVVGVLRRSLDFDMPQQLVDRVLVLRSSSEGGSVVTLGQDGLVANTAKYVGAQPIVAVNPEPGRFDGILLPFFRITPLSSEKGH